MTRELLQLCNVLWNSQFYCKTTSSIVLGLMQRPFDFDVSTELKNGSLIQIIIRRIISYS